jgi:hypothetical protein
VARARREVKEMTGTVNAIKPIPTNVTAVALTVVTRAYAMGTATSAIILPPTAALRVETVAAKVTSGRTVVSLDRTLKEIKKNAAS